MQYTKREFQKCITYFPAKVGYMKYNREYNQNHDILTSFSIEKFKTPFI